MSGQRDTAGEGPKLPALERRVGVGHGLAELRREPPMPQDGAPADTVGAVDGEPEAGEGRRAVTSE